MYDSELVLEILKADLPGSANNLRTLSVCKNSERFYRLVNWHGKT